MDKAQAPLLGTLIAEETRISFTTAAGILEVAYHVVGTPMMWELIVKVHNACG